MACRSALQKDHMNPITDCLYLMRMSRQVSITSRSRWVRMSRRNLNMEEEAAGAAG